MEQRAPKPPPDNAPTTRELAALPARRLAELLPTGWTVSTPLTAPEPSAGRLLLVQAPDGRAASLAIDVKAVVDARDVPVLAERAARRTGADGTIVAGRYASPRARERLAAAGLSFVDWTGNVRISVTDPGLMLTATGADRDPFRSPDRPTTDLRGRPAGRVVRALVDFPGPWQMRDLAAAAGTSLGSTARAVAFLDREDLITRDERGAVTGVAWEPILHRWAKDYELQRQGRLHRFLAPRGTQHVAKSLLDVDPESYAISGSMAAQWIAPYAEARFGLIYARDANTLASAVGARPHDVVNLVVIEPPDDAPFLRTVRRDGLTFTGLSQVTVDLLTGPGRNPSEGVYLMEWMANHTDEWRQSAD